MKERENRKTRPRMLGARHRAHPGRCRKASRWASWCWRGNLATVQGGGADTLTVRRDLPGFGLCSETICLPYPVKRSSGREPLENAAWCTAASLDCATTIQPSPWGLAPSTTAIYQYPAWRRKEEMLDGLSQRERAVLSWLRQGLSNKEIAQALSISPRTVQKHLEHVYRYLGVQTRVEAIVRVHQHIGKRGL